MFRTILVPVTGGAFDDPVFAAALGAARHLSAHLDFLHVRLDPADVAGAMASDVGGAIVSANLIDHLEAEAGQREDQARLLFRSFCARERIAVGDAAPDGAAVAASWHREIGREADWVAEYGRAADLLVVGRSDGAQGVAPETLEAALLETGRPLLIPAGPVLAPDTVAIAWKPTREAARAVAAATPFIERAKEVVVMSAVESDRLDRETINRLVATLRRHNPAVTPRNLHTGARQVAETLVGAAVDMGAGLLVMGGYGHSRLHEMVFGGVTEHVLREAPLPVLMAH